MSDQPDGRAAPLTSIVPHPARADGRLGAEERLIAGAIGTGLLMMLAIARWLEPDPSGVGTHTQLGLPPTFVMEQFGTPCPFCGMTTAWAHTMDADIPAAFLTQPAGALFALAALLVAPAALFMAATAWRPRWLAAPAVTRWGWRTAVAVLAAGWVYKLSSVWFGFPV